MAGAKFPAPVWLNPQDLLEEEVEGQPCGVAECFLQHPRQGELLWQSGVQRFISEQESEEIARRAKAKGMEEARSIMGHSLSHASGYVAVQKKIDELKGEKDAANARQGS